jgi:hypothetical protein
MEPEFHLEKEDPLYYNPQYLKMEKALMFDVDLNHNISIHEHLNQFKH